MNDEQHRTYQVGNDSIPYIHCLVCGMRSYNSNDITEKYCGKCHDFHCEG